MDEYLWNKTGSDPEIERIEVALESLACRSTAPPELPAKQLVFAPRQRPFFRLGFSFAATLLALMAFGSGWFLLRNDRPAAQQAAVKTLPEMTVIPTRTETDVPAVAESPKVSAPSKSKRRVAAARSVRSIAVRPSTVRPQTLVLTKEEADAYRQLMTALSITSANLKIVKDKIGGTE
jgi:hypothetical protein